MPSLQRFCQFVLVLGSVHSWTSRIVRSPLRHHHTQQQQQQQHANHNNNEVVHYHQQQHHPYRHCAFSSSSALQANKNNNNDNDFQHTLAILSMPSTSTDKIANEAILNKAVQHTNKLSVVLRAQGRNPSLARLRRYVGEVYSTLWDVAMSVEGRERDFCDVVVYPQNLPNAAPEQWIHHAPDLDSICGHDSICGWVSEGALGRGLQFQSQLGNGVGGLDAHVEALNADRARRKLPPVKAIHVDPWPLGASAERQEENNVAFLDDEDYEEETKKEAKASDQANGSHEGGDDEEEEGIGCSLIGGARIPTECLFEKVAVGGTFDGMHYGHRKLLTLAVSSVNPASGELMIGVTVDEMLRNKAFAEQIPNLKERMDGAREFVYRLAPGLKNSIRLRAISDAYGPPGTKEHGADFDALVLSHETLDNGCDLNRHRVENLGLDPLVLLCTRRTEPHGMSSTALRRRRAEQNEREQSNANR
jgi:cytidyltransferase-like protein